MKKFILSLNVSLLFAWNMQGFISPTEVSAKIWCYDGKWKNNFNYGNFPQISQIQGGEACWVDGEISLNEQKKDTYEWKEGWNFVTPIFQNWNLDEKFKGNALIAWKYTNNKWQVYNHNYKNIEKFNTLNIKEGAFVYIPKIEAKINTQALFCKNGKCSKVITSNTEYKFYLKFPQNKEIKLALDLFRYSNETHYKIAIGAFKIENNKITSNIPVCVEKQGVGGSCGIIDNNSETFLSYDNNYLVIDAQKIAKHFNKTIPSTKEKFLVKFYIQGANLDNFIDEEFGVLGIEGFGTWVSLHNSKKIEFEMEIK